MVFSSITFLFCFLPIVLAIYYIVPKKCKNIVLLISSFFFYFYGEPKYVILMAFSIATTYIFGILIDMAILYLITGMIKKMKLEKELNALYKKRKEKKLLLKFHK